MHCKLTIKKRCLRGLILLLVLLKNIGVVGSYHTLIIKSRCDQKPDDWGWGQEREHSPGFEWIFNSLKFNKIKNLICY